MATFKPLGVVIDRIVEIEEVVHPDLPVFRWQPFTFEPPAIFNWMTASPFHQKDTGSWRDTVQLLIRIGCRYTEQTVLMDQVETYTDAFRQVFDEALVADPTLGGSCRDAHRIDMRMTALRIGDIDVFGPEFVVQIQLDRLIPPGRRGH